MPNDVAPGLRLSPGHASSRLARGDAGAQPLRHPVPTITGFGDVALRFVDAGIASAGAGAGENEAASADASDALLLDIDHVALCVPSGQLMEAARFAETALGFREIFREYVQIGAQPMDSMVLQSVSGAVTFTLL